MLPVVENWVISLRNDRVLIDAAYSAVVVGDLLVLERGRRPVRSLRVLDRRVSMVGVGLGRVARRDGLSRVVRKLRS